MATSYKQARIPEERIIVKKEDDGHLTVYATKVECLGKIAVNNIHGKKIYVTPDGQMWGDGEEAAQHLAKLPLKGGKTG